MSAAATHAKTVYTNQVAVEPTISNKYQTVRSVDPTMESTLLTRVMVNVESAMPEESLEGLAIQDLPKVTPITVNTHGKLPS